jgi:hypothetical protein
MLDYLDKFKNAPKEVRLVVAMLEHSGFEAYIVGGSYTMYGDRTTDNNITVLTPAMNIKTKIKGGHTMAITPFLEVNSDVMVMNFFSSLIYVDEEITIAGTTRSPTRIPPYNYNLLGANVQINFSNNIHLLAGFSAKTIKEKKPKHTLDAVDSTMTTYSGGIRFLF